MKPNRSLWLSLSLALFYLASATPPVAAQTSGAQDDLLAAAPGTEYLTRGPLHEAFSQVIVYDPQPGLIVSNTPPPAIEEIPPDQRPDGDNVFWIPGYWSWDEDNDEFIWLSGIWRSVPPDRQWVSGYWDDLGSQQYQWISGYWASIETTEQTYLPQPPATVERGPSSPQPSTSSVWLPGHWQYASQRYQWSPGYWDGARDNWIWIPAHYVWTPRGYVFVDGYYDYTPDRRGVVFAPIRYQQPVYLTPGYSYQPLLAIAVSLLTDHLFVRSRNSQYYYGDYYSSSYRTSGYYPSYQFGRSSLGYDPIFAHQTFINRTNNTWIQQREQNFNYYRDNSDYRPPSTWNSFRSWPVTNDGRNQVRYAMPLATLAKSQPAQRFAKVSDRDRDNFRDQSRAVTDAREKLASYSRDDRKKGDGKKAVHKLPITPIVARARDIPDAPKPRREDSGKGGNSKDPRPSDGRPGKPGPDPVGANPPGPGKVRPGKPGTDPVGANPPGPGKDRPDGKGADRTKGTDKQPQKMDPVVREPNQPGTTAPRPNQGKGKGKDKEQDSKKPTSPGSTSSPPVPQLQPPSMPTPPSKEPGKDKENTSKPDRRLSQPTPEAGKKVVPQPRVTTPKPPVSMPTPRVSPDKKPPTAKNPSRPPQVEPKPKKPSPPQSSQTPPKLKSAPQTTPNKRPPTVDRPSKSPQVAPKPKSPSIPKSVEPRKNPSPPKSSANSAPKSKSPSEPKATTPRKSPPPSPPKASKPSPSKASPTPSSSGGSKSKSSSAEDEDKKKKK